VPRNAEREDRDPPHAPSVRTTRRRSIERKHAYSACGASRVACAATPALGGWGTYATIIAFGLAVCLTGYLAIGDNDRLLRRRSAATAPPLCNAAPAEAPTDAVANDARRRCPRSRPTPCPSRRSRRLEASYAGRRRAPGDLRIPGTRAARESRTGKRRGRGKARRIASCGAGARMPRNAGALRLRRPSTAGVATPPLPESIAADRLQQFASALGRCEREKRDRRTRLQGARAAPVLRRGVGRGARVPRGDREPQHPLAARHCGRASR
jgi:hypothetical protein